MSDIPDKVAAEQPDTTLAENQTAEENVRSHSKITHHADNFSLSALFLLTVTVAALLGFVSNAFPGRSIAPDQQSTRAYSSKDKPVLYFAGGVLLLIGLIEGGRAGYVMQRSFSNMLVGMFYGIVAAVVALAALFHPPSWLMIFVCCGMLFAIGMLLGTKVQRTMPS